jgi:peptidoglycan/xylan/chitin deacetylase (PgdA/CDA1 family)
MPSPAIPILTWHANSAGGSDYATNDHIAFREDLETVHRAGLRVVSLERIARALAAGRLDELDGCVGLSFDDGSDLDYYDAPHPRWGPQRSMTNILADFRARHGVAAQPELHATAFAIVSPAARAELDRTCLIGCQWWTDDWWPLAERTGLVAVESHGWDHNHDTLRETVARAPRGAFDLRTEEDAEAEIAQATPALARLRGRAPPVLFAYPYGEASRYLATEWFPRNAARAGVLAAFASPPAAVTPESSPWAIPRFVFGRDWKSAAELQALLGPRSAPKPPGERAPLEAAPGSWRDRLRTWEVNDATVLAGDLFRRCFGHPVPGHGRHFVLMYSPPPGDESPPSIVAYVHHTPFKDMYLGGGMCTDERIYRRFPRWLFEQVREEGGLATIVTRESVEMLGDAAAVFGHVGEPRARQADLRTGFVDTDREHLMVIWRRPISEAEKAARLAEVEALGPF